MTVQTGCRYVVGHRNPERPDHVEYCGKWVIYGTPYCAEHSDPKYREPEKPKKKPRG